MHTYVSIAFTQDTQWVFASSMSLWLKHEAYAWTHARQEY